MKKRVVIHKNAPTRPEYFTCSNKILDHNQFNKNIQMV
jgi:hypothetical protein